MATSPECSWAVAEPSPDSVLLDVKPPIHAGSGTVTISAFDNNSLKSRVASIKIAGQLFTVTQGSTSEVMTTVSAASYALNGPLAEQMIVSGFGLGLAYVPGGASVGSGLPTSLNGVTVKVKDSAGTERVAPLWYVSPGQINYYIPEGTKTGTATVTVSYVTRVLATGALQIEAVAPGLFAANANGAGVAAALAVWAHSDSSQSWQYVFAQPCIPGSCHSAPLDLGSENDRLYLQLYGTGIRGRSSLLAVSAKIGGVDAPVRRTRSGHDRIGPGQSSSAAKPAGTRRGWSGRDGGRQAGQHGSRPVQVGALTAETRQSLRVPVASGLQRPRPDGGPAGLPLADLPSGV